MKTVLWVACLILSVGASLMAAPASFASESPSTKTVVAEGVGSGGDRSLARDDALADAQRRAVEQGVGLYLSSETIVGNMEIIEDSILRKSDGYVESYRIVSEKYENQEYRVSIEARVRTGKIGDDVSNLADRLKVTGSPRIIIAIDDLSGTDAGDTAQAAFMRTLVNQGFRVVDSGSLDAGDWVKRISRENRDKRASRTDEAFEKAADLVIVGTASVKPVEPAAGLEYLSADATLDVRAVRTDTRQIVAASRVTTARPSVGFREAAVQSAAVESVADEWLERNMSLLVSAALDPACDYDVTITRCTQQEADRAVQSIRALRFSRKARLVSFSKGTALLDVTYVGDAQSLAGHLTDIDVPKLGIEAVSARSISAGVRK